MAAIVRPLSRNQIARIVGNDPEAIKAFERLFSIAVELTPADVAFLTGLIDLVQSEAAAAINRAEAYQPNNAILDYLDFRSNAPHSEKIRRLAWNDTDQTLNLGMEYDVSQQIGLEYYARVENETGVTIPNGTVVAYAGAGGLNGTLSVAPFLADGSTDPLFALGVMTHDLPDAGAKGYCTRWGYVRGVDTSAYSVGDELYASPSVAGGLTNVKPTAPNAVVPIAVCLNSDASDGIIFVNPVVEQTKHYGVFSKTDSTIPALINTAYPLLFTATEDASGISVGTPASRIVVSQAGLYQVEARVQITSSNTSAKNVFVWFRKNGVDLANSARIVTSDINNGYVTLSPTRTISLSAGDYLEAYYASTSTSVTIGTVAAAAFRPAAPAVVLTINQVQQ